MAMMNPSLTPEDGFQARLKPANDCDFWQSAHRLKPVSETAPAEAGGRMAGSGNLVPPTEAGV